MWFTWFLFPIWIDFERLTRKSRGIYGLHFTVRFYKACFDANVKKYGFIKAVKLYIGK